MNQFVLKKYPNVETGENVTNKYLNFLELEKEYQSGLTKMLFGASLDRIQ